MCNFTLDLSTSVSSISEKLDTLMTSASSIVTISENFGSLKTSVENLDANLKNMSKAFKEMANKFNKERFAVIDVSTKLQTIHTAVIEQRPLKKNDKILSYEGFIAKHALDLPLKNIEEFKAFEISLSDPTSSLSSDLVFFKNKYNEYLVKYYKFT